MFKWLKEFWIDWFSLDGIELLDDVYMQSNRLHPDEEDEC
jgi:hypothetical protein